MTDKDQSLEAFEAWFSKYHDEACSEWGGIDCTNPKGVAEEAWQAARSAPAAPVPQGDGWIPVGEQLPESGKPVLLDIGKKYPIRAMWAARFTLEADDEDPDWGEWNEDGDMYYCPEGWYEWNEHEETHWNVSVEPLRWMPLPQPPKEVKK